MTTNHLTLEEFGQTLEDKGLSDTLVVNGTLTFLPREKEEASPLSHALRRMQTDARSTSPELIIKDTLGEGGMGLVRLARQLALDRDVAVKTMRSNSAPNSASIIRLLLNEACITGLLEHPNIVPIYTIGQGVGGEPLIVMKRIEGRPWSDFIEDPTLIDTSEFGDALAWHLHVLIQICNAIHFAHSRGILHRDLKPENIMIGEFGEVCVLDWGIALALDDRYSNRFPLARDVSAPAGTPQYMAPEMAAGNGTLLGIQTDVYLLGSVLYQILVGEPPHSGQSMMEVLFAAYRASHPSLAPGVPEGLAEICRRAMAPSPQDRFSDVEELRRALLDYLRHRESMAIADEASERLIELDTLMRQGHDTAVALDHGFVECRFGFAQALRLWPENPKAQRELNRLLVTMFEFEIGRENARIATSLLAEITSPDPSLLDQLAALNHAIQTREEELESLKEVQHDHDVRVGSLSRGRAFQFFGLMILTIPISKYLVGLQDYVIDMKTFLWLLLPYFFLILSVTFAGRKAFFANRFNRTAFSTMFLIFGAICLQRLQTWWIGGDVYATLVNEFLFHAFGITLVGLVSDRNLIWASVPFWVGFIVGIAYPMMVIEIISVAGGIAILTLGTIWVRQDKV